MSMEEYRQRLGAIVVCLFFLLTCLCAIPIAALYGMAIGMTSPLAWLLNPIVREVWIGSAFAAVAVCVLLALAAYLLWIFWKLLFSEQYPY
jgi:hypothetical protein